MEVDSISRRGVLGAALASFATVALVREARATAVNEPTIRRWVNAQQEIAEALAAGRIKGLAWAAAVKDLARSIDVEELMAFVARQQITPAGEPFANDPQKRYVRFLENGEQRRLSYGTALFDFRPGNLVTPHGHKHMVSAHLIVAGKFRIRNFDRVEDVPGAMVLRPTRDYLAHAGEVSTMCSEQDNVHWFVPVGGEPARTFDVIISGLDRGAPSHVIEAVDPLRAERREDGALIAPKIDFETSSRRYTADV